MFAFHRIITGFSSNLYNRSFFFSFYLSVTLHRPEACVEREWVHLQIDMMKRELDKMVVSDAIALVEFNRTILFSQVEELLGRRKAHASRMSAYVRPISFVPHSSNLVFSEKERLFQSAVNVLVRHRIGINVEDNSAMLVTRKTFNKVSTDLLDNFGRWSKEMEQNVLSSTLLVAEVCFILFFISFFFFFLMFYRT
jgi:hypothetical protein